MEYFGLDQAATHMWQLIVGTSDISTAFEKLVLEGYDVETETLRQHLIELKRLDENRLLTEVPSDVADVGTNPAI